jgi:hypothetical protein
MRSPYFLSQNRSDLSEYYEQEEPTVFLETQTQAEHLKKRFFFTIIIIFALNK